MHENGWIEKDIFMELQSVMSIAMEAGEILLRNGAETYRVEESITKICNGFGFSCESIVLPTGIFNGTLPAGWNRDLCAQNQGQDIGFNKNRPY